MSEPTVAQILNDAGGFVDCDFCGEFIIADQGEFAVREAMCRYCQLVQLADLDDDEFQHTTGWSRPCTCHCHDNNEAAFRIADTYPERRATTVEGNTMRDYFDDTVERAVTSVRENEGHPLGVWSTGEKLVVALVLWDQAYLHAEDYTYAEAMDRVAGGVQLDRDELPLWLDRVRLAVENELANVTT